MREEGGGASTEGTRLGGGGARALFLGSLRRHMDSVDTGFKGLLLPVDEGVPCAASLDFTDSIESPLSSHE